MIEFAAAFIKISGKLSWFVVQKAAIYCATDPTNIMGVIVIGTTVLAGAYILGPGAIDMMCKFSDVSVSQLDHVSSKLDEGFVYRIFDTRTHALHKFIPPKD